MSTYLLQGMMRQEALKAMNTREFVALGQVMDYDPASYLAIVQLYPQEADGTPALQTGWLPVFTPWVGNGWGMFAPPSPGDIVEVHFQNGSLQNGYVALRSFTTASPPTSVPSGEFWLVHANGATLKLLNDGSVTLSSDTVLNLSAPVVNIGSGTVNLGNLMTALLPMLNSVAQGIYNSHTHGASTDVPNQQMGASSLSTNVKGN